MRTSRSLVLPVLVALATATASCTDAGLYALDDKGPGRPDRASFLGQLCVPQAAGEVFPTKVMFAIQGGEGVPSDVVGRITEALNAVAAQYSLPHLKFGLVAYHSVASGLVGSFEDGTAFANGIQQYASYQEQGPISVRAPLRLSRSILSGDMQSSCKGTVGRTRYVVVLLVLQPDSSCANPEFNADITPRCDLMGTREACSVCELTEVASTLTDLVQSRAAGEVTLQPIYVQTGSAADPSVMEQLEAISRVGGTTPRVVSPDNLPAVLSSLNYASLQRQLILKRMIAFNRNAISRAGEELTDSDGDGLADDDEVDGLDPRNPDTDGDQLMDGIERRMGMDPLTPNTLTGCNPFQDTDGDRLNNCEERVLGTNSCMGDTDADTVPDLVEALLGSNPLVPEDLADTDGDGASNMAEVEQHSDPLSADGAFRSEHGYGYDREDAEPTVDARVCYSLRVSNVGLRQTQGRINPSNVDTPAGTNDVYLYFQSGRANDPRGAGVSSLKIQQILFTPPTRDPSGLIPMENDGFVLGL